MTKSIPLMACFFWASLSSSQLTAETFSSDVPLAYPLVLDTDFAELGGTEQDSIAPGDAYRAFGLSFVEFGQSDPQLGVTSITYTDPTRFVKIEFQTPYEVVAFEIEAANPIVIEAVFNGTPVASLTTDDGGVGVRRFYGFAEQMFDQVRFYHSNAEDLSFTERLFTMYRLQLSDDPVNLSTDVTGVTKVPTLSRLATGILMCLFCVIYRWHRYSCKLSSIEISKQIM